MRAAATRPSLRLSVEGRLVKMSSPLPEPFRQKSSKKAKEKSGLGDVL
jgi:hypothetical protein